jgi:hypothetical protein
VWESTTKTEILEVNIYKESDWLSDTSAIEKRNRYKAAITHEENYPWTSVTFDPEINFSNKVICTIHGMDAYCKNTAFVWWSSDAYYATLWSDFAETRSNLRKLASISVQNNDFHAAYMKALSLVIKLPNPSTMDWDLMIIKEHSYTFVDDLKYLFENIDTVWNGCNWVEFDKIIDFVLAQDLWEITEETKNSIIEGLKKNPVTFIANVLYSFTPLADAEDLHNYILAFRSSSDLDRCVWLVIVWVVFVPGVSKKVKDYLGPRLKVFLKGWLVNLSDIDWSKVNTRWMIKPEYHYEKHWYNELLDRWLNPVSPQEYFDDAIDFWNINKHNTSLKSETLIRDTWEMGRKIKTSSWRWWIFTKDWLPVTFFYY